MTCFLTTTSFKVLEKRGIYLETHCIIVTVVFLTLILTALNLFIGLNTTIAVNVMMLVAESDPELKPIEEILDAVFLIFPHFCLGRGLLEMAIGTS